MTHGGNVHALARRLNISPEQVLDFSASINPLGPPMEVLESLRARLGFLLRHYPEPEAHAFRAALAARLGLSPDQIIIGNGSNELIHLLPRLFDSGRALILSPAFSEYEAGLRAAGWGVEHFICPVGPGFDLASVEERLEAGFELVYLARPTNPAGQVWPSDLILHLARLQEKRGRWLVVDEAFIEFTDEPSLVKELAGHPALIVLGSLTKFYALPGLRLGFAAAGSEIIEGLEAAKAPWSVNSLAQEAGLGCLDQKEFAARTRTLIQTERPRLARALGGLGLEVFPSEANYVLARLKKKHPSAGEVGRRLAEKAILVRNCADFVGLDERHLRLAVRRLEENERLIKELGRVLS